MILGVAYVGFSGIVICTYDFEGSVCKIFENLIFYT